MTDARSRPDSEADRLLASALRKQAALLRAWDKYELSGPVPGPLDYIVAAKLCDEAANELERDGSQ